MQFAFKVEGGHQAAPIPPQIPGIAPPPRPAFFGNY